MGERNIFSGRLVIGMTRYYTFVRQMDSQRRERG
jgi:hypothetical protein